MRKRDQGPRACWFAGRNSLCPRAKGVILLSVARRTQTACNCAGDQNSHGHAARLEISPGSPPLPRGIIKNGLRHSQRTELFHSLHPLGLNSPFRA